MPQAGIVRQEVRGVEGFSALRRDTVHQVYQVIKSPEVVVSTNTYIQQRVPCITTKALVIYLGPTAATKNKVYLSPELPKSSSSEVDVVSLRLVFRRGHIARVVALLHQKTVDRLKGGVRKIVFGFRVRGLRK